MSTAECSWSAWNRAKMKWGAVGLGGQYEMSTIEEIVKAVRDLPPKEQDEVKRRLDSLMSPSQADQSLEASTETKHVHQDAVDLDQRIQQALYGAGLVSEIKPPVKRPRERRPPINIKGQPLSETIIEDRR
jgi:hypothetical protein